MTLPSHERGATPLDSSKRQERANRILDAATALILRWGYNKTTIDDIARQAGVAKGTIYLHWKTREELFVALIKRERVALGEDFRQRISQDPTGWTLRSMFKHVALALTARPLLKAVLLRDMEVVGKLAHSEHSNTAYIERLAGFRLYLEFLRDRGLVRTDMSLEAQLYTMSAIFMGFFLVAPLVPDELRLSEEERASLMAEAVHRTLEAERPVSAEELQTASRMFMDYVKHTLTVDAAQFQDLLDPAAATAASA